MAGANMAERLVQHKHCPVCGKAMSVDKETCSDECATTRQAQLRDKRRTLYLFYFSIVVLAIVLGLQFMTAF
jgi:predicted nucleic acid-binding Zn ribbon protein